MNIVRHDVALAVATTEAATATTAPVFGRIDSIHITYAGATVDGFATTAVVSVVSAVTQQTIWSETLSTLATTTVYLNRYPRRIPQTTAGVALTATESLTREQFVVADEPLVVTASAAGAGTRNATVRIITS